MVMTIHRPKFKLRKIFYNATNLTYIIDDSTSLPPQLRRVDSRLKRAAEQTDGQTLLIALPSRL